LLAVLIILILIVAAVSVVLLANRARSSTGTLSRETRRRDKAAAEEAAEPELSSSTEIEAAGRERAADTRATLGGGLVRRRGAVVEYEPVDEEELGVTRRQFLNRATLTAVLFSASGFGAACLAFLWPFRSTGFGGEVTVDIGLSDIKTYIETNGKPYYVPLARTYIELYPANALPNAKRVYKPIVYNTMEQGIVALYQRCVHLGCRVPFCDSSQWFECPCHGSKYNAVGEKKAGPAPRGLDHWPVAIDGESVKINTAGSPLIGAPIGVNTTGQEPEGPLCV
jgi:cytochrome b6-f complex iron-sulfur subunit